MYYPYLRGKQFELLALREFSQEFPSSSHICPIIEPVKKTINGLTTAIKVLMGQNIKFALVLNPKDGDYKRIQLDILEEIPVLKENKEKWIPAFIYRDNPNSIKSYIKTNELQNVMIIFLNSINLSEDKVIGFLENENVLYIVANIEKDRSNRRRLLSLGKQLIRLDDQFNDLARNADYLNIPEEKFSEEHIYYKTEGYAGFSDYTTLPSIYKDSGMLPYAVAIHMTYQKSAEEIFIRHFVSDSNWDHTNIHGKFYEAASKFKTFFLNIKETPASKTLIQFLDEKRYPGLGVIKKLSIKNHLELIENCLSQQ